MSTSIPAGANPGGSAVRYLDRGEGRIGYDVAGPADAPLVVCLPGMGDLRTLYRFNVGSLLDAGYRVATMDLRGQGDSDPTFERSDDFATASDIVALIECLGGPALVYGNSMSSAAAVVVASQRSDLVAGLVLTGPFVRDQPMNPIMARLMPVLLSRPWGPAAWVNYYSKLYTARRPVDFAEYKAILKNSMKRPAHWKAFQALTRQLKHAAVEQHVASVKAPALVVMGTRDHDFKNPTAEGKFVADRLGAELLLVEGAGHYAMVEFPEIVNPRVLEFAKSVFGA